MAATNKCLARSSKYRTEGNLSTPKSVQKLQMALPAKAKAEAGYRFYALYDKISRESCPGNIVAGGRTIDAPSDAGSQNR
jgi:RNA-directed DNA polymerase